MRHCALFLVLAFLGATWGASIHPKEEEIAAFPSELVDGFQVTLPKAAIHIPAEVNPVEPIKTAFRTNPVFSSHETHIPVKIVEDSENFGTKSSETVKVVSENEEKHHIVESVPAAAKVEVKSEVKNEESSVLEKKEDIPVGNKLPVTTEIKEENPKEVVAGAEEKEVPTVGDKLPVASDVVQENVKESSQVVEKKEEVPFVGNKLPVTGETSQGLLKESEEKPVQTIEKISSENKDNEKIVPVNVVPVLSGVINENNKVSEKEEIHPTENKQHIFLNKVEATRPVIVETNKESEQKNEEKQPEQPVKVEECDEKEKIPAVDDKLVVEVENNKKQNEDKPVVDVEKNQNQIEEQLRQNTEPAPEVVKPNVIQQGISQAVHAIQNAGATIGNSIANLLNRPVEQTVSSDTPITYQAPSNNVFNGIQNFSQGVQEGIRNLTQSIQNFIFGTPGNANIVQQSFHNLQTGIQNSLHNLNATVNTVIRPEKQGLVQTGINTIQQQVTNITTSITGIFRPNNTLQQAVQNVTNQLTNSLGNLNNTVQNFINQPANTTSDDTTKSIAVDVEERNSGKISEDNSQVSREELEAKFHQEIAVLNQALHEGVMTLTERAQNLFKEQANPVPLPAELPAEVPVEVESSSKTRSQ